MCIPFINNAPVYVGLCRTVRLNKQGGIFKLPTLMDPIFTVAHGARDCDKKIVGNFLVEETCMYELQLSFH